MWPSSVVASSIELNSSAAFLGSCINNGRVIIYTIIVTHPRMLSDPNFEQLNFVVTTVLVRISLT